MDIPGLNDLPSNSQKVNSVISEPESPAENDTSGSKKVIQGVAVRQKRSIGARLKDMFIEDGGDFADQLVKEVVIPKAKEIVLTVIDQTQLGIKQMVEQAMFGQIRTHNRPTSYGTGRPTNYNGMSTSIIRPRVENGGHIRRTRRSNVIDDVVVSSLEEGELILEELDAKIDGMRHCTVADLYELAGIEPTGTDDAWGWTNLDRARVRLIGPNRYLIVVPRPQPIDNG